MAIPKNTEPVYCPFCKGENISFSNCWDAKPANHEPYAANAAELDEHICRNESCGRSFWV